MMMERIGVRELRQNASRYLALVKSGQSVEISERGTLVAVLVPSQGPRTTRERLIAAGRLAPAMSPTGRVHALRPVRIKAGEPSNQELLDSEREEHL
ncbi:type II toxin-antitoxin system prevent-host-death family antitoxin [Pseudonocardia sp. ICBG601]|uniref:type II toxin-antitoxin system Phd/YefM family antitoxin n=1 Tax=Pseudonocardia sp. ICBG601 TaxID=2846759 RepID=UPI0027E310B1|nr:type II toxin-antitoxin system prevent-host-death family antitoxin [Pseudonocardia sp. ICBG601]